MYYMGIESSCDETAAAIVRRNGDYVEVISHELSSSIDTHVAYGGVVPEVAARSHVEVINPLVEQAIERAKLSWSDVAAIGVTNGPGLSGSLLIGTLAAKTLSFVHGTPLYGLHHVLGHVYASFVKPANDPTWQPPEFPLMALIVSGGHTQLVYFRDHFDYEIIGRTLDDAVGEAFDKVAKIIGLPYPGGPSVSARAVDGNEAAYTLPNPRTQNPYDFSFSGLKTAVLREVQRACGKDYTFPSFELRELLNESQVSDFAASFEKTAVDILLKKTQAALTEYDTKSFVLAGGVAANRRLRAELEATLTEYELYMPAINLCTDNAVMMATLCAFESQKRPADSFATVQIHPSVSM